MDRRRFRPNILIGGVDGLAERQWEGKQIRIGEVEILAAQLRARCVMTTYDPDTLVQDRNVLFRIVKEFDGTMALDCSVSKPGTIRVGDQVTSSSRQAPPLNRVHNLANFYVTRSCGDLDVRTAAPHCAFQLVTPQSALHGDRQVRVNRSGTGMHVKIESAA